MGTIDLSYYAYLASNVPPLEIARAVAVRARRAVRAGLRRVLPPPKLPLRRLPLNGPRPSLLDPAQREETSALLHARFPESCGYVLREAESCLRGELAVFGKWKDCSKGEPFDRAAAIAPIDYARDPLVPEVRYDARQPGLTIDLLQAGADAKAVWEVGRLQQLWRYGQARWLSPTEEGRAKYARAYIETIRQFNADNPAGMGVQWSCAMEVSARAMHIALSFVYLQDDPAIDAAFVSELCDLLEQHCLFIEEHLEETAAVRTNHYAADLVGLVVVGALFPELPRAALWLREYGCRLWAEIPAQTREDGTHFESSMGYQRLCAELFLAAMLAARAGGAPAPRAVEQSVSGLFRSIGEVLKPGGEIPQIGDLDSCRGLPLVPRRPLDCGYLPLLGAAALHDARLKPRGAACPVEVAWLLGPAGVRAFEHLEAGAARDSLRLEDAGVGILRAGEAYLCLSAGPNGQGGCGGHAHNDKNGIELSFGALDLVVDRGTFVYARDPGERNRRRGTAGHSTVQVDGAEQNRLVPGRLFALPDTAGAQVVQVGSCNGLQIAIGEHGGYQRLAPGVRHRRTAALEPKAAAFCDELLGAGEHLLVSRWYVPQAEVVERLPSAAERASIASLFQRAFGPRLFDLQRAVEVRDASGKPLALFAFAGSLELHLELSSTDISPGYAELAPARLVAVRAAGATPAVLHTAIVVL